MLKTRDIWQDGQGGVSFLSGTHIAKWVIRKGLSEEEIDRREIESLNFKEALKKCVERLNEIFWFGILEEKGKSLELLKYQLGISGNLTLGHKNMHTKPISYSENTKQKLSYFMPLDLWLYGYARELFDARYKFYKTGVWVAPEVKFPDELSCQSTRFVLKCNEPKDIYYVWNKDDKAEEYRKILPKK